MVGISLNEQEFHFDFRALNSKIVLSKRISSFSSAQSQTGPPSQPFSSGSLRCQRISFRSTRFFQFSPFCFLRTDLTSLHFWQKCGEKWLALLSLSSFFSIWQKSQFGLYFRLNLERVLPLILFLSLSYPFPYDNSSAITSLTDLSVFARKQEVKNSC